ncbi:MULTISPECIES: hypothetical protein [unclassified Streptomyces]|uniref:hypothetical protein n=1 Tax=unclassified Streptomyces TaxID=2593676 RepID=UPI0036E892C6
MTAHTLDTSVTRRPETGWARARRLRERAGLRTCVPAVAETDGSAVVRPSTEGNIVRGED